MYDIELVKKIECDGFYVQIVKSTNTLTGKIIYSAVGRDSDDNNILMPIHRGTLEQVTAWGESKTLIRISSIRQFALYPNLV